MSIYNMNNKLNKLKIALIVFIAVLTAAISTLIALQPLAYNDCGDRMKWWGIRRDQVVLDKSLTYDAIY